VDDVTKGAPAMMQTTEALRPTASSNEIEVEGLAREFKGGIRAVDGIDPRPEPDETGLLWRLILVLIGFGMALTGWLLILSIFLSFIGLPLFIFGLALMQSQER
jgi:hypothetical protein